MLVLQNVFQLMSLSRSKIILLLLLQIYNVCLTLVDLVIFVLPKNLNETGLHGHISSKERHGTVNCGTPSDEQFFKNSVITMQRLSTVQR